MDEHLTNGEMELEAVAERDAIIEFELEQEGIYGSLFRSQQAHVQTVAAILEFFKPTL